MVFKCIILVGMVSREFFFFDFFGNVFRTPIFNYYSIVMNFFNLFIFFKHLIYFNRLNATHKLHLIDHNVQYDFWQMEYYYNLIVLYYTFFTIGYCSFASHFIILQTLFILEINQFNLSTIFFHEN